MYTCPSASRSVPHLSRAARYGGETTMALPPGTPDGAPPPPGHCAVNVAIPDGASGQQWISIRTHRLSAMAHMHIYNVLKTK